MTLPSPAHSNPLNSRPADLIRYSMRHLGYLMNMSNPVCPKHIEGNELFTASCSRIGPPSGFQISGHSNCIFPDAQSKNFIAILDSFYFFLYATGWHILSNLLSVYPRATTSHHHYCHAGPSYHCLSPSTVPSSH